MSIHFLFLYVIFFIVSKSERKGSVKCSFNRVFLWDIVFLYFLYFYYSVNDSIKWLCLGVLTNCDRRVYRNNFHGFSVFLIRFWKVFLWVKKYNNGNIYCWNLVKKCKITPCLWRFTIECYIISKGSIEDTRANNIVLYYAIHSIENYIN